MPPRKDDDDNDNIGNADEDDDNDDNHDNVDEDEDEDNDISDPTNLTFTHLYSSHTYRHSYLQSFNHILVASNTMNTLR
jgi:hypothetical protein